MFFMSYNFMYIIHEVKHASFVNKKLFLCVFLIHTVIKVSDSETKFFNKVSSSKF